MARLGLLEWKYGVRHIGRAAENHIPGKSWSLQRLSREKMEEVTARTGVPHGSSNADCASRCKYLILAVKPQYFETVFQEIEGEIATGAVIISLAPGITIRSLKDRLWAMTNGLPGLCPILRLCWERE